MTTAQIFQNIWAGLATASALALLGLYLNMRRKWLISWEREGRLLVARTKLNEQLRAATADWNLLQQEHTVLRQEFERKLDLIVELEHQLDRTKPLKRT